MLALASDATKQRTKGLQEFNYIFRGNSPVGGKYQGNYVVVNNYLQGCNTHLFDVSYVYGQSDRPQCVQTQK